MKIFVGCRNEKKRTSQILIVECCGNQWVEYEHVWAKKSLYPLSLSLPPFFLPRERKKRGRNRKAVEKLNKLFLSIKVSKLFSSSPSFSFLSSISFFRFDAKCGGRGSSGRAF